MNNYIVPKARVPSSEMTGSYLETVIETWDLNTH